MSQRRRWFATKSGSLLDAVTDLSATDNGDGTVTVAWTAPASAPGGIRIYRQEVDADGNRIGSRLLLDTVDAGDEQYIDPFSDGGGADEGTLVFSSDFSSGDFTGFQQLTPLRATVIDDPTGSGRGKVAQLQYLRTDTGASADTNISFNWLPSPGYGLGEHFAFKGEFYIPTPAADMLNAQRKLFYLQKQTGGTATGWFFLKLIGTEMELEMPKFGGGNDLFRHLTDAFTWDTWHTIEIEVVVNTAVDNNDGILRVWLDDVLVLESTNRQFSTSTNVFNKMMVGQQCQEENVGDTLYDEVRYWDNVQFAENGRVSA